MRTLFALCLAVLPCAAQIQLWQVTADGERITGSGLLDIGMVVPGDTQEIRFRLRNIGSAPATVLTISVAGAAFRAASVPVLPYVLAPSASVDFRVSFAPAALGSYSANLTVNTSSLLLRGTAAPGVSLLADGVAVPSAVPLDFGRTATGTSVARTLQLKNSASTTLTVASMAVAGDAFQLSQAPSFPLSLPAGASVPFEIRFAPLSSAQAAQGTLKVDGRVFQLTGAAFDPPLPSPAIVLDNSAVASGQQVHLSISLASAAPLHATGTLTMEFQPAPSLGDDAAVRFVSGNSRAAAVTVEPGDNFLRIGGQKDAIFQTGTTAGTIVFTLKVADAAAQLKVPVPAAAIAFDTAAGVRRVNDLDISLIGFDNTHAASQMSFTFYDLSGKPIAPGAIRLDESADFRKYFDSTRTGGAFALRAVFPVTGDASKVGGVDVELANPAGVARTRRITF